MKKNTIRLRQSDLNKIITETVTRMLTELRSGPIADVEDDDEEDEVLHLYTIDIDDMATRSTYKNEKRYRKSFLKEDEAIDYALDVAKILSSEEHCLIVSVSGAFLNPSENWEDIGTIFRVSNKDERTTKDIIPRGSIYAKWDIDEYLA